MAQVLQGQTISKNFWLPGIGGSGKANEEISSVASAPVGLKFGGIAGAELSIRTYLEDSYIPRVFIFYFIISYHLINCDCPRTAAIILPSSCDPEIKIDIDRLAYAQRGNGPIGIFG